MKSEINKNLKALKGLIYFQNSFMINHLVNLRIPKGLQIVFKFGS